MTVVMNLSLRVGGEIVMMFPRFTVEETIKLINKHKITCLPAVPTIYTLINTYKNNARYNLRSLKACICGGAPLPLEVKKEFERRMVFLGVKKMTERHTAENILAEYDQVLRDWNIPQFNGN